MTDKDGNLSTDDFVDGLVPNEFAGGPTPTGTSSPKAPEPKVYEPIAIERMMGHTYKGKERENLEFWLAVAQTSEAFTKPISGKGYRGTDINPTYRAMQMTKLFGPYGAGWGVESCTFEKIPLAESKEGANVALICTLVQWYLNPYTKDKCLIGPHTGGEWLIRNGKFDDEAYKKVQTDAMTAAWRFLGICSDVYMGMWDNSKYQGELRVDDKNTREKSKPVPTKAVSSAASPTVLSSPAPSVAGSETPVGVPADPSKAAGDPLTEVIDNLMKEWSNYESLLLGRGMVDDKKRHETVRTVKQRFRDEIAATLPSHAGDLERAEATLEKLREFVKGIE